MEDKINEFMDKLYMVYSIIDESLYLTYLLNRNNSCEKTISFTNKEVIISFEKTVLKYPLSYFNLEIDELRNNIINDIKEKKEEDLKEHRRNKINEGLEHIRSFEEIYFDEKMTDEFRLLLRRSFNILNKKICEREQLNQNT